MRCCSSPRDVPSLQQQNSRASSLMPQPSYANQVQRRTLSVDRIWNSLPATRSGCSSACRESSPGSDQRPRAASRSNSPANLTVASQFEAEPVPLAKISIADCISSGYHGLQSTTRPCDSFCQPPQLNSANVPSATVCSSGISSPQSSAIFSDMTPSKSTRSFLQMPTFTWESAMGESPDLSVQSDTQAIHQ